jgi:hypothetical protein
MSDQTFDSTILALVRQVDAASPPSPHRHFVRSLIQAVHASTGRVHAESWYRRLIVESGSSRRPSTRTVNSCVLAFKDQVGQSRGPTQIAVIEMRKQYGDLLEAVNRVERLVSKVAEVAERQASISASIDKRQMIFTDQSQVYQRQIDQLAAIMKDNLIASREVTKGANEVTMSAARALRDLQAVLQRLSSAQ